MTADTAYKTELVSPICTYEDIPTIHELVRQLRHKGAFSNSSCGIHVHVEAAAFNARTLRNLVNIFYSKEDLLFQALQVNESRWGCCKPTDERFLRELNRKRPQTMQAFQKIWYGGQDGSLEHYHASRYHALNLHSVFSKGTVEFRLFNSTVEHAGKIKADIQLCLAGCVGARRAFVRFAYSHWRKTLARCPRFSAWHKPRPPDCPFSLSSEWNERSRDLPGAQPPGVTRPSSKSSGNTDASGCPGTAATASAIPSGSGRRINR